MSRIEEYRRKLSSLKDWAPFLRKNSGLPGPRGNLELAQAVAELASPKQIEEFLAIPNQRAKENTAGVFLVFCGVIALGMQIARGGTNQLPRLRAYASDPRWRIREATAMALQFVGDQDLQLLLSEARQWAGGNWYEKRAAAAAVAEPRLLKDPQTAREVIALLDRITSEIASAPTSSDESRRVLRQAMGYCWSVAIAAFPEEGKPAMEKWLAIERPDVRWIMKENLKKNRLVRLDPKWVKACAARLA